MKTNKKWLWLLLVVMISLNAFANAEAKCPNRINRVFAVVLINTLFLYIVY